MAKNEVINVFCFDQEIGRLGYDENKARSSFQYNPAFLESNLFPRLFPETGIIKKNQNITSSKTETPVENKETPKETK